MSDAPALKLDIDWTRCDGHGLCHALLPEVIDLDEWGFPLLPRTAVPERAVAKARRVAAACPELALRLTR